MCQAGRSRRGRRRRASLECPPERDELVQVAGDAMPDRWGQLGHKIPARRAVGVGGGR